MNKKLLALEDRRMKLYRSRWLSLLGLIAIGCLGFIGYLYQLFFNNIHNAIFITIFGTCFLIFLMCLPYHFLVNVPYKLIRDELKETLVHHFITEFHPEVKYKYTPAVEWAKDLLNGTIEMTHTSEEDGLELEYRDTTIRMSDLRVYKSEIENESERIFQGWFLHVHAKGKFFPRTEFKSRKQVLPDPDEEEWKWQEFIRVEDSFLSYITASQKAFKKEIVQFIPFLDHLVEKSNALRIIFDGDEIFMFLETEQNFLDNPELNISDSLLGDRYIHNIAKQINTFLFIAETLTNDYDTSEVEERLELKILSMLPSDVIL